MAGAHCQYCGNRCFVTCPRGMAHDREQTGHDHTTAINPSQSND